MIVDKLFGIEAKLAYFTRFNVVHRDLKLVSPVFDVLQVCLFVFERVDFVSILLLTPFGLFVLNFV